MGGQARPAALAGRRAVAKAPRRPAVRDEEESPSRGLAQLAAGALAHMSLSAKAALRRRMARPPQAAPSVARASSRRELVRREPAPVGVAPRPPLRGATRQEPQFGLAPAARAPEPVVFDREVDFEAADDEWGAAPAPSLVQAPEPVFASPAVHVPEPTTPSVPERTAPIRQPPTLRIPESWKFGRKSAVKAEEPRFEPVATAEDEDEAEFSPPAPLPVAKAPARSIVQAAAPKPKLVPRVQGQAPRHVVTADTFDLPPLELLTAPKQRRPGADLNPEVLEENARLLEGVLDDFGVRGEIINVRPGPVVTLYELEPAPGIKSSRVISLADDIARSMSAIAARVAVIPGRNVIGIELPNQTRETVFLRELIGSTDFDGSKAKLALTLGKTIGGEPVIADLAKMPHLLVAGTTGSGKSVAINTMILGLVYRLTPEQCRLIMIDPKMLELSVYDGIPHLLTPVVTDPKKAVVALKWTVREMEDRYKKMSKLGVRNIDGFNQRVAQAAARNEQLSPHGPDRVRPRDRRAGLRDRGARPRADALHRGDHRRDGRPDDGGRQGDRGRGSAARADGARAGIHVIMATQRPSVDVITGTIKANFPTRISFQVTSKIDSRTILGEQGAEQLLGQGDMLFMAAAGRIQRVHGPLCRMARWRRSSRT
jgi:S-DNA-T family DNA segregation ATPase FtsK/SpoIIIE